MKENKCTLAVYYFPQWHVDPKNQKKHSRPWTEWEKVRDARPRFPGHDQPKVPLWGYEDEANPAVMEKKIKVASEHGVDVFLFDWYYNDDGPFLQRALEEGFMPAPNPHKLRFALMWANHALSGIPGEVSSQTFDAIVQLCVDKYFSHPSYWVVDGSPYFSIYQIQTFINSFGSVSAAADAIAGFRQAVRSAGFKDLHLNVVSSSVPRIPDVAPGNRPDDVLVELGVASLDSYVWIHHVRMPDFPQTDYRWCADAYFEYYDRARMEHTAPLHPNVSMGWDSTPRTDQSGPWDNRGYPYTPVLAGNTPNRFREALRKAVSLVEDLPPEQRIVTINSWNEWTEGSYLEPDTSSGLAYLEAIRDVCVGNA